MKFEVGDWIKYINYYNKDLSLEEGTFGKIIKIIHFPSIIHFHSTIYYQIDFLNANPIIKHLDFKEEELVKLNEKETQEVIENEI